MGGGKFRPNSGGVSSWGTPSWSTESSDSFLGSDVGRDDAGRFRSGTGGWRNRPSIIRSNPTGSWRDPAWELNDDGTSRRNELDTANTSWPITPRFYGSAIPSSNVVYSFRHAPIPSVGWGPPPEQQFQSGGIVDAMPRNMIPGYFYGGITHGYRR